MTAEGAPSALKSLSAELADAVERVAPSVVRVDDGSRLTATGMIWSADGTILTTSHGVERDEHLAIVLGDGTRHAATLVGRDPDIDVAVLRVNATGLPAFESAPEDAVKVGSLVLALGRPGDSGLQATLGIISARFDTERAGEAGYILHTDAVLYPGFSGGALVDIGGRVAGMTNLMFGHGKGVAVGMPVVAQVARVLLQHGRVRRGYLGIRTQTVPLPESLQQLVEPRQERAVLILHVEAKSAAERGGLLLGDIVLRLDGQAVQDGEQLRQLLRGRQADEAVKLTILRGGQARDMSVTLGVEE